MRKLTKLLSLLMALIIAAGMMSAFPLTAYADSEPFSMSGYCGAENETDVEWFAFNDNSMVFFGTGAIRNYTPYAGSSPSPWYSDDFRTISSTLFINKIAVEYGITAIGDYCFSIADTYPYQFFIQLKNIDIADSVTSIGKYAFYNQKMQEVMIPPSVTHIGENAFKNCRSLKKINYFGNPDSLVWDTDGETDTEFYGKSMTVHILNTYTAAQVRAFNAKFAYKNITFTADMDNPYAGSGEELDRNIALYYGAANSQIFGGAAPYIIVGRFDGKKKSVTHGSNGFASCVMRNNQYYILTDNTTGKLNLATVNATSGKAEGYAAEPLDDLKLSIRHEYIGSNTVKVIYQLKNTGTSPINDLKVGGTGDIKIGADDFASIEPLKENDTQVGFYMKSNQVYDKNASDDYATLGFIGRNVEKTKASGTEEATYYPDANFFYGVVDTTASASAAGAQTVVLIPQRIFAANTNSQTADSFAGTENGTKRDSGMSYYWQVDSLAAGASEEYAILFSVYGAGDDAEAQAVVSEQTQVYHTVTWQNEDGTDLQKVPVKDGETTPAYTGTPEKPSTEAKEYRFSGWKKKVGDVTGETVYTTEQASQQNITADTTFIAQYEELDRYFFIKHSLSIDGDIGVNYYVDVTRLTGVTVDDVKANRSKVKLKFRWFDKASEFIIDKDAETKVFDGKECFKAKCSVNAAEMAYDITATAEYSTDGGTTWTTYNAERDIYSVREYAKVILNTESDFSKNYKTTYGEVKYTQLRNLMIATLDYGAKAQLAFNRKTNDLANNIFATYGVSYTMEPKTAAEIGLHTGEKTPMKTSGNAVGLKFAGSSVVYLSKTSIRHYYTVENEALVASKGGPETLKAAILAANPGYTCHEKDHGFYFEFTDIPAAKLDEQKKFTVNGADYYFSVLNYSQMVLNSSLPQADQDLAVATYWYNDAANTFFGV